MVIGWKSSTSSAVVRTPTRGRNSLSHPFSTDPPLDSRWRTSKMSKTFCSDIVSNIVYAKCVRETLRENAGPFYIARGDGSHRDHATPAPMVGRAGRCKTGARRPSAPVFDESSDRSGSDLRTEAQGILAAGGAQDHALSRPRDRQGFGRDCRPEFRLSLADRRKASLSGDFGAADCRHSKEFEPADFGGVPERRGAAGAGGGHLRKGEYFSNVAGIPQAC